MALLIYCESRKLVYSHCLLYALLIYQALELVDIDCFCTIEAGYYHLPTDRIMENNRQKDFICKIVIL
jgi:hypothetical protein